MNGIKCLFKVQKEHCIFVVPAAVDIAVISVVIVVNNQTNENEKVTKNKKHLGECFK